MAIASAPRASALAKSDETRRPPVMTRETSLAPLASRKRRALERAKIVGIEVASFTTLEAAPVAPARPSTVTKSGPAESATSKSASM